MTPWKALCAAALLGFTSAHAQSGLEAAKQEGKVLIYGSMESGIMDEVRKAFSRKYGIATEYYRAASNKTLDRVLTEARAGRVQGDVVVTNRGPMLLLSHEKIFARYVSPEAGNYPEDLKDREGFLSPIYRMGVIGILYNTRRVKREEAPKRLEDLASPRWRGKWVMPDPSRHFTTGAWLFNFGKLYGEGAATVVKKLAEAKPTLVESFIPSVQKVISGEADAGITYLKYVHVFGKDGAPLDYVRLPALLADGHQIGIPAKAPHPNAARLFEDFFLSREGMELLAKEGEFVSARGLYPPIEGAEGIKAVPMDEPERREYRKWAEEMRRLFVPR